MIHKFQNIHGISYTIPPQLKDYKEEFLKLIQMIIDDKKAPFSDVYVKMPVFWLNKFLEFMNAEGMKYKELQTRHEIVLIKF